MNLRLKTKVRLSHILGLDIVISYYTPIVRSSKGSLRILAPFLLLLGQIRRETL